MSHRHLFFLSSNQSLVMVQSHPTDKTKQTRASIHSIAPKYNHHNTILVQKVFSYLKDILPGPMDSNTSSLFAISSSSSITSGLKRSARLQTKKARALGIDSASLLDQDILFINSLTSVDIVKLGARCRISFPSSYCGYHHFKAESNGENSLQKKL